MIKSLSVAEEPWWLAPAQESQLPPPDRWKVPAGASREDIEAEVRRRAARHRQELRG